MYEIKVSFIVPLYNEERTIVLCLDSIVENLHENDEIIIVDNGSTDNSIRLVRNYDMVRLLGKPGITIGALRNLGAEVAKGDILAFIDADCVICRDWRDYVVDSLKRPAVVACGSKYDLPANADWIEKAWFSQKKHTSGPVSYINSGNLAINKTIFLQVGGFDEKLVTGEDAELGWRLNSKGYLVLENPSIKAIHLGNPKDIISFYKKQRWHSLGMFGTFRIKWFDKPVMMTIVFIFSIMYSIASVLNCYNVFSAFTILLVPMVTATYRCIQYNNFCYFLQLVYLYLVYFTARVDALLRLCFMTVPVKARG